MLASSYLVNALLNALVADQKERSLWRQNASWHCALMPVLVLESLTKWPVENNLKHNDNNVR